MDFSEALSRAREHSSIVERMELALRSDPLSRRMALGLGSAQRRALRSQQALEAFAAKRQIDLIRYRLINNSSEFFPVESVTASAGWFQRSFTGAVDFLENGAKDRAKYAEAIENKSRLNFAYTFSGSLGIVFSVENDRDIFQESKMDDVVDVFSQFLNVSNNAEAIDASRALGGALISQLCAWVDTNAKWENAVDFVVTRATDVQRGEHVPKNKFFDLHDIFQNSKDEEPHTFTATGMIVGIDTDDRRFHFVVPNGDDFKGALSDDFPSASITVPSRYRATIVENITRAVATGKERRTYTLGALEAI